MTFGGRAESYCYLIVILTDMKVVSNLFGDLTNCPIKRHIIFVSGNISARNTAECNVHTARLHNEKHCDILSSLNATQS